MSLVDYDASSDEEANDKMEQDKPAQGSAPQPQPSKVERKPTLVLPDAAQELNSRKRSHGERNGNNSLQPRSKLPHGNLPTPKLPPDTAGGRLVPPQLRQGRRNVVTEDLDKLFVRKQTK